MKLFWEPLDSSSRTEIKEMHTYCIIIIARKKQKPSIIEQDKNYYIGKTGTLVVIKNSQGQSFSYLEQGRAVQKSVKQELSSWHHLPSLPCIFNFICPDKFSRKRCSVQSLKFLVCIWTLTVQEHVRASQTLLRGTENTNKAHSANSRLDTLTLH